MPARGEVVEHLGDGAGVSAPAAASSRGQLAVLVELDQQLELGVAELPAGKVRVAAAQAAEARKRAGRPPSSSTCALAAVGFACRDRLGGAPWSVSLDPERLDGGLGVGCIPARGPVWLSARSSTRHGISESTQIPNEPPVGGVERARQRAWRGAGRALQHDREDRRADRTAERCSTFSWGVASESCSGRIAAKAAVIAGHEGEADAEAANGRIREIASDRGWLPQRSAGT